MRKKYSTKKITQINRDSISLLYIFTSHFSSQLPALSFCFGFASEILEGNGGYAQDWQCTIFASH